MKPMKQASTMILAAALAAAAGIRAAREGKGEVRSLQSYHASIEK